MLNLVAISNDPQVSVVSDFCAANTVTIQVYNAVWQHCRAHISATASGHEAVRYLVHPWLRPESHFPQPAGLL